MTETLLEGVVKTLVQPVLQSRCTGKLRSSMTELFEKGGVVSMEKFWAKLQDLQNWNTPSQDVEQLADRLGKFITEQTDGGLAANNNS